MTEAPVSQRRRPWSEEHIARLRELAAEGRPAEDIARLLDRTREGVRGRAQALGIRIASSRRRLKPWYAPTRATTEE